MIREYHIQNKVSRIMSNNLEEMPKHRALRYYRLEKARDAVIHQLNDELRNVLNSAYITMQQAVVRIVKNEIK